MATTANRQIIKRFLLGLGVGLTVGGLLFAFYAYAHNNSRLDIDHGKIADFTYEKNEEKNHVFAEPIGRDWEDFRKTSPKMLTLRQKASDAFNPGTKGGQCVPFAKNYLGLSGTWGYGGKNLVPNSGPAYHAVVLFYGHVGVQIGETETQIQVIDSNSDWKETIKIRWIDKDNPSIRGYWKNVQN